MWQGPSRLCYCRLTKVTSRVLVTSTPLRPVIFNQLRSYRHFARVVTRETKQIEGRVIRLLYTRMPRPSDTYTHSQFTAIESENTDPRKTTVRCNHCKSWTGNIRSLDRKKLHLTKCVPYCNWRAAGNGEELQPSQVYNTTKRGRISLGNDQ